MKKSLLLLGSDHDPELPWLAAALLRSGLARVEQVTATQLGQARSWRHSLGEGAVESRVTLRDGRELVGGEFAGVVNRLETVPCALAAIRPADREYVAQEWHAFLVSWLHGFGGTMFNRPSPSGLSGVVRSPLEWRARARNVGLPVWPVTGIASANGTEPAARRRAWVIGAEVLGAPDVGWTEPCRRLAAGVGGGLLGVDFAADAGRTWRFLVADPRPPLAPAGPPLVSALQRAFAL